MGIVIFIIGTIMGSFLLVVGMHLPKGEDVIIRRSECESCHQKLKWYHLIPIFSYIFLKGKCAYCHEKIAPVHFFTEIISGLLFLYGYLNFGISIKLFIYLTLLMVAITIFVSDFKYMIILDSPLIIGSIIIIILRYFEVGLKDTLFSIFYGLLLFVIMFLIKKLGDLMFKKESLGGGDIKLSFLIGLSLGYPYIGLRMGLISLIFASFLALPYAITSVYLNKKNELPYGPFLIAASLIIFIFYDKFTNLLVLFTLK